MSSVLASIDTGVTAAVVTPTVPSDIFSVFRNALHAHLAEPADPQSWQRLLEVRREAARSLAHLPKQDRNAPLVDEARALIREITASGIHDAPLSAADRELAESLAGQSWPGLLGGMLLAPAWQWDTAPSLQDVPDWLWGDFTRWLFSAPQGFTAPGQASAYADFHLQRAEELLRWVSRNRGSAVIREAITAYVSTASSIPLYFDTGSLKAHATVRGKLLAAAHGLATHRESALPPTPREGRRLRVGFVSRHFGPQTETYTTLPTFEHLDPNRFEVILYALRSNPGPLEDYIRTRAAQFEVLPASLDNQVEALRAAALDVVVFGTNVTAVLNDVTRLALHRVAPLQVVNNSSCITSGLPEIDLYVSGSLTEAPDATTHFTERLGLLPGPAHAFNYQADAAEPTVAPTRVHLGIPEDALVFVTASNYYKIIPEMRVAWARLLAAVPNSYLLVHPFNPNWSSQYPITRFAAEFDRVLAAHGVASHRLIVSANRFPSRTDVKELLRVGDLYLDTFPFGGVNSLVDPLELGLPVVVWEGGTFRSRMGAALLRELRIPELIATDASAYHAIALRLATDAAARRATADRIGAAMGKTPLFLDPLAASDAFGRLIETAYDEMVGLGTGKFRASTHVLAATACPAPEKALQGATLEISLGMQAGALNHLQGILGAHPNHGPTRLLLGRSLLAQGDAARAGEYLLAALSHSPEDGSVWLDLARALRLQNRMPQAIEALQRSLELDPRQFEAWLMLVEIARNVGVMDLARDALGYARQLMPDDPRVLNLTRELGQ